MIVPFDASALEADDRWVGEGIEEVLALGLSQHPALVQVDRARIARRGARGGVGRARGRADGPHAARGCRPLRKHRAQGRQLSHPAAAARAPERHGEPAPLDPLTVAPADLLTRLSTLPGIYARALKCR